MTKSQKRKAKPSFEPTNKRTKTTTHTKNKMPKKKKSENPREEFTGSLDAAIKMLKDNCNLLKHITELNKTPFRHIFRLITKMKGKKKDMSWCKRYNNCMRQLVDSYNVKKKTIKVGEMEIALTEDKVRTAFGIVDGSIRIDIDKKKIDETKDGKDFISRCFPEKKRIVMVVRKKDRAPKEDESENDEEEMEEEQMIPKVVMEPILGKDLSKKLMENKLSSSDFARVATLYLLTWVFTPTLGFTCPLRNLHFVGNMGNICSYNWSRAILDSLNRGLERNKERNGTKSGCVIILGYCLCEETKLIEPLNTSFPRFARWDLKQLHTALKKTKLVDVDPEMVVDYIKPSEEERRRLQGEMPEEGMKLLEWYGGTSRDSEENRGENDAMFKDLDETVAKVIKMSYESEIAELKRELEVSKKEKELKNEINEELERDNRSLRSLNILMALQLEEYKTRLMKKN